MDGLRFSVLAFVVTACVIGCQPKLAPTGGDANDNPRVAPDRPQPKVVKVSTVNQFVEAIKPNTIVQLAPGTYDVSRVARKKRTYVVYEESYGDTVGSLAIRNVRNLTIAGPAGQAVKIITPERYSTVLTLRNCRNLKIEGIRIGHSPDPGHCTGGVVQLENVRGITLTRCELFGCGTEGLNMADVSEATFRNTTIRDCTYGILTLRRGSEVTFLNCRFAGNKEFHGMHIHDSEAVTFRGCTIERNVLNSNISSPLFNVTSSSDVRLIDSTVRNNTYPAFQSKGSPVQIERTKMTGNTLWSQSDGQ